MSESKDKPKGPLVWFDMDRLRGRIEPRLRHVEDNVVHRVKSRQLLLGGSCPCDKVPLAQVGLWELERQGREQKKVGLTTESNLFISQNDNT